MTTRALPVKIFLIAAVLLVLISCKTTADFQIKQIPQPPPTSKIRIFTLMISGEQPRMWETGHKEWAIRKGKNIAERYKQTDIYDVIPHEALYIVMNEEPAYWEWKRNDWELAKQVGRALHADYILTYRRDAISSSLRQIRMMLINLETEKKIEVIEGVLSYQSQDWNISDKEAQTNMFNLSKEGLLATALRRGISITTPTATTQITTLPSSSSVEKPVVEEPPEITPQTIPPRIEVAKPTPPILRPLIKKTPEIQPPVIPPKVEIAKALPIIEAPIATKPPKVAPPITAPKAEMAKKAPLVVKPLEKEHPQIEPPAPAPKVELAKVTPVVEKPVIKEIPAIAPPIRKAELPRIDGKRKIIVYDIDTSEQLKVVALILSETARQEFLTTGLYSLINRENIKLVLEEHKLRASGLIDDKKASVLGNWMAADEAVTGKLSLLGDTLVLQLKVINIDTVETLAIASIHGALGREVELIRGMPALVRKLVQERK